MSRERLYLFDTTLRDGALTTGVDFSLDDKRNIAAMLDRLGVDYVNGADSTKIAVWVGGKHSNARSKPTFHKLVVANLPNNPPRWPEVEEVVRKILYAYKEHGRPWERMGEWIDRIGWPRFFELTGFAFTKHHLDTWTGARKTMNMSAHIHF